MHTITFEKVVAEIAAHIAMINMLLCHSNVASLWCLLKTVIEELFA